MERLGSMGKVGTGIAGAILDMVRYGWHENCFLFFLTTWEKYDTLIITKGGGMLIELT
jgi:hypothetical protein